MCTILTKNEEASLIQLAQSGDVIARNALWVAFDSYGRRRARQYAMRVGLDGHEAESLVSDAFLKTLDRFDLMRGLRFSTYFDQWIRGTVGQVKRLELKASVFDTRKRYPSGAQPKFTKAQLENAALGWAFFTSGVPEFFDLFKHSARRHDRIIARNLWVRYPPRSQVWLAKRLKISRSAVSQRRKVMSDSILDTLKKNDMQQMVRIVEMIKNGNFT